MAIGDVNVIAEVTDTLTNLLSGLEVTLDSPAELQTGGDNGAFQKINLYLYQVLEHAFTKNQPRAALGAQGLEYPPLTVRLYYMLTPYASDAISAHKVLGHAMQVFYDNAIVMDESLTDALRLATDRLSIVLLQTELDDLTRIWNALQTPYRLSVCYEVRVVPIESTRVEQARRVTSRENSYAER